MTRFVVRRIGYLALMLLASSVFVFALTRARGDPRILFLGNQIYTTQENWDAWGREMGLDKPLPVQYLVWAAKAVTGDFGHSLVEKRAAWTMIRQRIPATLELGTVAFAGALIVAIPLGVLSAVKRGSVWDLLGRMFALFGQALPAFWVGLMLILIFAVILDWFPTSTRGSFSHIVLPAVTLGWSAAASSLRLVRSSMLEVLDSEYVKFARAKGVSGDWVVWKHALRNSMIPPLTHFGLIAAAFISGQVVVEQVFAWPGIGRLAIDSVFAADFPVVAAVVILFTVAYVGMNLLVDLLYAVIDPRIRFT